MRICVVDSKCAETLGSYGQTEDPKQRALVCFFRSQYLGPIIIEGKIEQPRSWYLIVGGSWCRFPHAKDRAW
jgi:hypothetical protein